MLNSPHKGLALCRRAFIICVTFDQCHRLKRVLREKLEECGWRDEVRAHCRGAQQQPACLSRCFLDTQLLLLLRCHLLFSPDTQPTLLLRAAVLKEQPELTAEELVAKVKPKGRAAVPDSVKADLLARLRTQITV